MKNERGKLSRSILVFLTLSVLVLLTTTHSFAEDYPSKPINLTVGFSAGGGVDAYARGLSQFMQEVIGQPVIVVNKPGAGGMIAARYTKDHAADGYVLNIANAGALIAKALIDGDSSPVKPLKDFQSLGTIGETVSGILVPYNSSFANLNDLIAYAKKNPGKLRWAHPGRGSLHMMVGETFLNSNGVEAQDVPFKGASNARNAVVAEQVDFAVIGLQNISGFESKMRAIGVSSSTRDSQFPDVPTVEEQGLPKLNIIGQITVFGRRDLPEKIRDTLVAAIRQVVERQDYRQLIQDAGMSSVYKPGKTGEEEMAEMEKVLQPVALQLRQ